MIEEGSDADIVVFDPAGTTAISAATHHMRVDYNPYEGRTLSGAVDLVMARGAVVVSGGRYVGTAGRGQLLETRAVHTRALALGQAEGPEPKAEGRLYGSRWPQRPAPRRRGESHRGGEIRRRPRLPWDAARADRPVDDPLRAHSRREPAVRPGGVHRRRSPRHPRAQRRRAHRRRSAVPGRAGGPALRGADPAARARGSRAPDRGRCRHRVRAVRAGLRPASLTEGLQVGRHQQGRRRGRVPAR